MLANIAFHRVAADGLVAPASLSLWRSQLKARPAGQIT
jgi:hypothetical protein